MHIELKDFWGGNSKFGIKNKFIDTWQLLDPAGGHSDPGIEVTYQKSDHEC